MDPCPSSWNVSCSPTTFITLIRAFLANMTTLIPAQLFVETKVHYAALVRVPHLY